LTHACSYPTHSLPQRTSSSLSYHFSMLISSRQRSSARLCYSARTSTSQEIVSGEGWPRQLAVEWWTLGVFIFELLYGATLPRIYSTKEPARRFGATTVKCHPFFNGGVNWALLLWCTTAPYVPPRRPPMALDQGGSTRPHLGHGTGRRRRHSMSVRTGGGSGRPHATQVLQMASRQRAQIGALRA
jgi:hypothetical protein